MRNSCGRAAAIVSLLAVAAAGVQCQHRPLPDALSLTTGPANPAPVPPEGHSPPDKSYIADRPAATPEEALAQFTLPDGFEIQLVAAEPELRKPMQLAFDERGRLLVSTSTNYPLGPGPDSPPSDRVLRLTIDDATGKATDIAVFAEGFDICSGIEALPGGRVVLGHAPDILLLEDRDGDGRADSREVLYTGFKRDDTHEIPNSFTWGADGWLYGLQGHVNRSDVTDKNGVTTAIHHGNVYRMRPDGSAIEVWARGMSNPWGLTFDLHQNMFAADCESRPLWQIVRGYAYQGFLQAPDPLGNAPFITEDHHGASGFAGLVYYSDTAFPADYRGCLYLGNPISGIVHRDALRREGSTWHAVRQPDFLTSTDPWFRPVDVELGPDGALYIADWYNSVISHVEVPLDDPRRDKAHGRVWRVVAKDAPVRTLHTDWAALSRAELIGALAEPNTWIRRQAAAQLAHRFPDSDAALLRIARDTERPVVQRTEALWLAQRMDGISLADLEGLAADNQEIVRAQVARLLIDEYGGNPKARALAVSLAADASALVAREASAALARVRDRSILVAMLDDAPQPAERDTLLDYGQRLAMSAQLKDDAILASVEVAPESPAFARYARVLAGTPTEAAAERLATLFASEALRGEDHYPALVNILQHGSAETVARAFGGESWRAWPVNRQRQYARALDNAGGRAAGLGFPLEESLEARAAALAGSGDPRALESAMEIAARRRFVSLAPQAMVILADRDAPAPTRSFAAAVAVASVGEGRDAVYARIADAAEPAALRQAFAEHAAKAADPGEALALLEAVRTAPALVLKAAVLILATRKETVETVFASLESGALSPAHVNEHMTRMRLLWAHNDQALLARYDAIVKDAPKLEDAARERIASLTAAYPTDRPRDKRAGQIAFEQNCMVCHRIGGVGGMRGPNLDGMINRGLERLLQDMLLPSQDVDPAFRTTRIVQTDGTVVQGQVIEESGEEIVVVDDLDWTSYIAKADVAERGQIMLSPMPADIGTILDDEALLDLTAFLLEPPAVIERIIPVPE